MSSRSADNTIYSCIAALRENMIIFTLSKVFTEEELYSSSWELTHLPPSWLGCGRGGVGGGVEGVNVSDSNLYLDTDRQTGRKP